jgi:hypothetical protein
MDDEWKLLISEATDEIKQLPAEKAVKENKLEENSAQVEIMFRKVIIPTLKELKVELDKHNTPARVTSSENTFPDWTHYGASITVDLSGLFRGFIKNKAHSADYPEFFYEIGIEATPYKILYNNKCHITDTKGRSRELSNTNTKSPLPTTFDLTNDSSPDLTSDNIKWDFGLRYKYSVEFLRTTEVYGKPL